MTVWAEAFDLPHVASPGKKIAWLPLLDYRWGKHADAFREEGSVTLPVAYSRLNEVHFVDPDDHSNDVGSVVHLFQRDVVDGSGYPKVVGSFVPERLPNSLGNEAVSTTQLSGRGLTSYFLDRVKLWAFDHPNNPSKEDDWIFGGENLLTNPGLEDGQPINAKWSFYLEENVDGGQYRITIDGDDTRNIDWDETGSNIADFIVLDITAIASVSVTGSGTEESPFEIEVTDPSGTDMGDFVVTDVSLTNGTVEYEELEVGGLPDIDGWQKSVNLSRNLREHGTYASDGFRLTEGGEPVHSGDYALRINGLTRYAGAMQLVRVKPGHRYTASIWIRTGSSTDRFRFVFRDKFEKFVAGPDGESGSFGLTPDTWTEITHEFTVPEGVTELVFRIAVVTEGNPLPFYVDDGVLAPGTGPATVGDIWEQLLLDAQTDHDGEGRDALSWLSPTFDDTTDSDGNAWDTTRSVTLNVGDSYGQIAEAFQNLWGYVHRVRFDRADNTYYFDVFNPQYTNTDHSATDTGTLMVGMNILGGELIKRTPEASFFRATNDEKSWVESSETDLMDPWGWAENFIDAGRSASDDIDDIITEQKRRNLDQMVSLESSMTSEGQVVPHKNIEVFDKVGVQLGGKSSIPLTDMVITSIVTSGRPGQAPNFQVYVNSDAFASTGAAALAEAVRRLLRRSPKKRKEELAGIGFGGGGGGMAHVLIVSDSEVESVQKKADFVVPSSNSSSELQSVFDIVSEMSNGLITIWMAGEFQLNGDVSAPSRAQIRGLGNPVGVAV